MPSLLTPNLRRPYASIVAGDFRYQLTPEDVLWAARAAVFEGGEPADVLWTLTQRFVLLRSSYPTFTQFVRAFSQPINPIWAADGTMCAPGGKYAGKPECSPERLARRARASTITWHELEQKAPSTVVIVLAWANGHLPNPLPRATNFADQTVAASYLSENPTAKAIKTAGNVYIVEAAAQRWAQNHVTMRSYDGSFADADGTSSGSKVSQFGRVVWRSLIRPFTSRA